VRKFSWKDEEALATLKEYTRGGTRVEITGIVDGVCRDPKDDMVFECAVKSDAKIILSGDNDLLSVKTYSGIQVLTARQ
jgi:putative PIN family toxin of toxin-antitoxin system